MALNERVFGEGRSGFLCHEGFDRFVEVVGQGSRNEAPCADDADTNLARGDGLVAAHDALLEDERGAPELLNARDHLQVVVKHRGAVIGDVE